MQLRSVVHCCQFAAPYEGNFLRSLVALEKRLQSYNCKMSYVFPESATSQAWWKDFAKAHNVYTTIDNVRNSVNQLNSILQETKPNIIHTHFDGYDVPVVKAVKQSGQNCKVIWHLRDMITFQKNPIKVLYQHLCFFLHYYYYAKDVAVIGVSDDILTFVERYRTIFGGNFSLSTVIRNGIDVSRLIQRTSFQVHEPITFLTYGGRNVQKRIDLLLQAASSLMENNNNIQILVTEGVDTKNVFSRMWGNNVPSWCRIIPQSDNINSLLSLADCFVSTSVHETFSNAICEATLFGLPVIQSNIPGTIWNQKNPSTFVFLSEDSVDLERAMLDFLNCDREKLAKDILVSRENNIKEYSVQGWCDKILHFYKELV